MTTVQLTLAFTISAANIQVVLPLICLMMMNNGKAKGKDYFGHTEKNAKKAMVEK